MKVSRRALLACSSTMSLLVGRASASQRTSRDANASSPVAEPGEAQTSVVGDGVQFLPAESTGELSVIAFESQLDGSRIPFVVRNDSLQIVSRIEVKMEARVDGKLTAVENSLFFEPATLTPGDIGLGYFFVDSPIDPSAEFSFKFVGANQGVDDRYANVQFGDVEVVGNSVVGECTNPVTRGLESVGLVVVSFAEDGTINDCESGFISELVNAGETTSFQIELYGTQISHFLIAGSGRMQ